MFYIVILTAHLSAGSFSIAQITRDVGEIAVIEGDDLRADPRIIIPPTDPIGNPCPGNPVLTVDVEQVANTLQLNLDGSFFDDRTMQYGLGMISRPFLGWSCGFGDFDHDGGGSWFGRCRRSASR